MTVYFGAEGGFANQIRTLTFGSDGEAVVEVSGRRSERTLDGAAVEAILAQLDGSGLFDQDREYTPTGGADLQRYEIRYGGFTVVAHDTTVPAELAEAIRLLEEALRAG